MNIGGEVMNKPIYNLFPTVSEGIDSLAALALDLLRSLNHDGDNLRIYECRIMESQLVES
jgi:hypothetical protein